MCKKRAELLFIEQQILLKSTHFLVLYVTKLLLKKNLHQHDKSCEGSKLLKESSPRKKIIQTLKISRAFKKKFPG